LVRVLLSGGGNRTGGKGNPPKEGFSRPGVIAKRSDFHHRSIKKLTLGL
jgi:hypothetical protein